jgi:phosphopantothenoylcysteine decarboxylase/phosphopantothenate--cysteine ligase
MDLIVANDITEAGSGFAVDTNRVTIIDRHGKAEGLPLLQKSEVAHRIWDRVASLLAPKTGELFHEYEAESARREGCKYVY